VSTSAPAPDGTGTGDAIRVLVVDDHALFRRGLEMVLAQESDIDVVGEAADGAEAVELARELTPDVVLMDVRMPRRGGIEACTGIKDVTPTTKIVMLTISDEEADLYDAIKAGASGYLSRRSRSTRSRPPSAPCTAGSRSSARRWRPSCSTSSRR
jgi:DNA-binding NarL/FixJ family response regulator